MRVMGAFASRRVYPPAPRLNCRALSFFVRLSAHAHISRERLGNWFRGRDSNPRQPAYEAGLEPSPGTPIYMAGTVGNRTHHKRFKVKRGPSTVAVWSRTTRLGESTPAQVLWSGTVPDGIAPLRLSHTDIRPDTSEQCSFQRGYGDASEARTRTLQRERLMTLPIRLWHRRKEIWLGKRLLLPCRHGMDTAPVGFHHYILLSLSLVAVPAGLEPATP